MRNRVAVAAVLMIGCKSKAVDPPGEPTKAPAEAVPAPKESPKANTYKMEKVVEDGCGGLGFFDLDPVGMKIQLEIPAKAKFNENKDEHGPGVVIGDDKGLKDRVWALNIKSAGPADTDFDKAKAEIEKNAKEQSLTLKWAKAEKSADGYRLAYTSSKPADSDDEPAYLVSYLRTISGKKFICSNFSFVQSSLECAMRACESIKAS